jgi:hypothetical protein
LGVCFPKQSTKAIYLDTNFLGYAYLVEVPKEYFGAVGFLESLTSPKPE